VPDNTSAPEAAAWLKSPAAVLRKKSYAEQLAEEPQLPKEAEDDDGQ
jgi:hypothetical protein